MTVPVKLSYICIVVCLFCSVVFYGAPVHYKLYSAKWYSWKYKLDGEHEMKHYVGMKL